MVVVSKNLNGRREARILEAFLKSAKTFCGHRAGERRSASRASTRLSETARRVGLEFVCVFGHEDRVLAQDGVEPRRLMGSGRRLISIAALALSPPARQ